MPQIRAGKAQENFLIGSEFYVIRATAFTDDELGVRPIGRIGANYPYAF